MEGTMRIFRLPPILFKLFPQIYWKENGSVNDVFLTFDDGPHPDFTPKILDILVEENVSASFFLLGQSAELYPELVRQIYQSGHTIAMHSYQHQHLFWQSKKYIYNQLNKCKVIIEDIIQNPIDFFRPPYGCFSPKLLGICQNMNLQVVLWSMMSYDFDSNFKDDLIMKIVDSKILAGDVIVFHDGHFNSNRTVRILSPVLQILKEKGFRLKAITKQ